MKKYLILLLLFSACFAGISNAACKSSVNLSEVSDLLDKRQYSEVEPRLVQVTKDCPRSLLALSYFPQYGKPKFYTHELALFEVGDDVHIFKIQVDDL